MTAERSAATRAFEDAILRFETALGQINAALTAPPSGDEAAYQTSLEQLGHDAAPLFKRQQAFNAAVAAEIKHQRAIQRAVIELFHCQSALMAFLRAIKPYVDTRDFADVLRAITDEDLKRTDALLARDRRRELQIADVVTELTAIRARLDELQRALTT